MNRPRQNQRDHQSDSRKNVFLRGVKIEKAIFYVKAILSITAALRACIRQFIQVSGFAARRAFTADGSFPDRYSCLRMSAGFIFAIRLAMK
jgi:hypothetical protein